MSGGGRHLEAERTNDEGPSIAVATGSWKLCKLLTQRLWSLFDDSFII
jgi:hypothetical protein